MHALVVYMIMFYNVLYIINKCVQMCTNILTFNVVVLKYNPTVLYQPPSKLLKEKK